MEAVIALSILTIVLLIAWTWQVTHLLTSQAKEREVLLDTIRTQALGGYSPMADTKEPKTGNGNNFMLDHIERAAKYRGDGDDDA